ncbi:MAG: SIR2 family protein [Fastidiosipilaceae bacterium]
MSIESIFEFSKSNNEDNIKELINEIKRKNVVPFVGAGLSAFVYPTWGDLLSKLAGKIKDLDSIKKTQTLIETRQFEDAADEIHKALDEKTFFENLRNIYSAEEIEEIGVDRLRQEAAYVLPFLFQGNLITTNFDKIIEWVYSNNKKFLDVAIPRDLTRLDQVAQDRSKLCLFKMHGDINSENKDIIFTKNSYEKNYTKNTELKESYTLFIKSRKLLFLGCSLESDRTMEVLKDVYLKRPGVKHYAIVECPENKKESKIDFLSENFNISAILYPKGEYEAVRAILDYILKKVNPSAYKQLPYSRERQRDPSYRFSYQARTELVGRDEEIERLEEFCLSGGPTPKWWAVTGEGGSGKSKLAHEFSLIMRNKGWKQFWIDHDNWDQTIQDIEEYDNEALIVIDYVKIHVANIGRWLSAIQRKTVQWRILLIEREGEKFDDSNWVKLIDSGATSGNALADTCYQKNFLRLEPLDESSIKTLIKNYAVLFGKNPKDETVDMLYEKFYEIDNSLQRPLFALFITELWLTDGNILYSNKKETLSQFVNREKQNIANAIDVAESTLIGSNKKYVNACLKIKMMATMLGGLDFDEIKTYCKDSRRKLHRFCKKSGNYESVEEFLADSSIDYEDGRINPLRPDLLGEYFVLQELENIKDRKPILQRAWKKPSAAYAFFDKMTDDFLDMMTQNNLLEDIRRAVEDNLDSKNFREFYAKFLFGLSYKFLFAISNKEKLAIYEQPVQDLRSLCDQYPDDSEVRVLYASGLFNLSNKQDLAGCEQTVKVLKMLHESYPDDSEVRMVYAFGLVNLSNKQDLAGCEQTVEMLKSLHESYPDDSEVRVQYASGLVNLSNKQDLAGCEQTVEMLKSLHESYPDDSEVRIQYAKGLFNLSNEQDLADCEQTVEVLKTLHESYPDDSEVRVLYAKGLVNLIIVQDLAGCEQTVEVLKMFHESYPDDSEVRVLYAKGLVNLIIVQDLAGCEQTVEVLKSLHESYPDDSEVRVLYAKGLFNLSNEQDPASREQTVEVLKSLHESYPDDSEVRMVYASGLVNLIIVQDLAGCEQTVEVLKMFHESYPDDSEVRVLYASGLVNLSNEQDLAGCEQTVEMLKSLHESYPDDSEVRVQYASGLVNLSNKQDLAGCEQTVEMLKSLHESYPDDSEVRIQYAKGLFNLSNEQDLADCEQTVEVLKMLHESYPDDSEVRVQYASGLVNLIIVQDLAGCEQTVEVLKMLHESYPDDSEVRVQYASGLFNLSNEQDPASREQTVEMLKSLHESYPDDSEVRMVYAFGLVNLSNKQDLAGCEQTVEMLKSLHESYPDDSEVRIQYAKGLVNLSNKQDLAGCEQTVEMLKSLHESYPDDSEVQNLYIKALGILRGKQDKR